MTRAPIDETDYYPLIEAELKTRGLTYYHTHTSRRSVAGFPDYTVMGAGSWLMFAEVKAIGKSPTADQWRMLHLLRGPWRASVCVAVDALDELYQLLDNMRKPGTLDSFGMPGFGGIVVLGSVRLPSGFAGGVRVGRGLRAAEDAAAPTPGDGSRRRPCSRRSRRAS